MHPAILLAITLSAAPPGVDAGRRLFNDPGLGKNGVACAACHATVKDEAKDGDGLLRAGHSLFGVARRPFWRGDRERRLHRSLADATDVCVQIFQGGEPLEGADRTNLARYLSTLGRAKKRSPALVLQPALEADLDYDRPQYQGGDASRGRALFYQACHACHPHGGVGLGPAVAGLGVAEVAQAVREGNGLIRGSRKAGAWMPAYGQTRLSDDQVADLAAFLSSLPKK